MLVKVVWDLGGVIWRSLLLAVSLVNSQVDPKPYRGALEAHRNPIGRIPKGSAPRRHLRPTAGRAIPIPFRTHRGPRRTPKHAGGTTG